MTHTRDLSVVSPGRIHYGEGLKLQADLVKNVERVKLMTPWGDILTSSPWAQVRCRTYLSGRRRTGPKGYRPAQGRAGWGCDLSRPVSWLSTYSRSEARLQGLHRYMRDLEAVLIGTAAIMGLRQREMRLEREYGLMLVSSRPSESGFLLAGLRPMVLP